MRTSTSRRRSQSWFAALRAFDGSCEAQLLVGTSREVGVDDLVSQDVTLGVIQRRQELSIVGYGINKTRGDGIIEGTSVVPNKETSGGAWHLFEVSEAVMELEFFFERVKRDGIFVIVPLP
jgi:hypothetical protein